MNLQKILILSALTASLALAQSPAWPTLVSFAPGSPTDTHCTGGQTFADISATFPTLRYGSSFQCKVTAPTGFYIVRFWLVEPNQTTAGARVFTISTNGQTSDQIDIVARGFPAPTTGLVVETTAVSYFGVLRMSFDTVTRFAVVSQVDVVPIQVFDNVSTPGPLTALQIVASSFLCSDPAPIVPNPASPVPSCAGLRAATFTRPDGSTTSPYILTPAPALDARWAAAIIP